MILYCGSSEHTCFKQIEWDLAGFLPAISSTHISCPVNFINPLDWLQENGVEFRGYCWKDPAKSHSICLKHGKWFESFDSTKSCHFICFKTPVFPLTFWASTISPEENLHDSNNILSSNQSDKTFYLLYWYIGIFDSVACCESIIYIFFDSSCKFDEFYDQDWAFINNLSYSITEI
jgi:hypothetical protein